jgi:hypothetical protein
VLAHLASAMLRRAAVFLHVRPRLRAVVLRGISRFPLLRRQLKSMLLYGEAAASPTRLPMPDLIRLSRRTARVLQDLERARARADSRHGSGERPL